MAVKRRHALNSRSEMFTCCFVELRGCGHQSGAEGLGEIDGVPRVGAGLSQNTSWMHHTHRAETILGLSINDGVAAGDDGACLSYLVRAATQYVGYRLRG